MDIKNASKVEDALHRVLWSAYEHARCDQGLMHLKDLSVEARKEIIAADEWLLRQALFGPEGYFPNGKLCGDRK